MKHSTSTAASTDIVTPQLKNGRNHSVAEQERDRRMGFAAAYQQRLASLLWSKEPPSTQRHTVVEGKVEEGESLLSSSWRHLLGLPNLLLMPTLGPSRTRALESEGTRQGNVSKSTSPPEDDSPTSPSLTAPSSPGSASSISLSPSDSSYKNGETSQFRRRGVMNPLEGDADVSAYVSGLGLPIDPDLELSSVVHLQTFRTKHTSKSRRGSLEKPTSTMSGEAGQHRRAYSENRVEPTLQNLRSEALFKGMFSAKKAKAIVAISISEEGQGSLSRSSSSEEEQTSSTRSCSRPAVQAPVPGNYSAYNSSESGEEEEEEEEQIARRQVRGKHGRVRGKRGRRRSCSPPANRKQCAIGLFDTKRHGRSEEDSTEEDDMSHMIRVRSSPNLTRIASKNSQRRLRKDDRGRAGSVKIVPVSLTNDGSTMEESILSPVGGHIRSTSVPSQSFSNQSSLGLGMPPVSSMTTGGRACMVSNGAHLLMLSLELEMMRHRKITCSLKPRWLKARFRSESFVKAGQATEEGEVKNNSLLRNFTSPNARPRMGSSLRYEVIPT